MNLLTSEMLERAAESFRSLIADDGNIRVVVLAAAGKGFCAGHDLKEIRALRRAAEDRGSCSTSCSRMMLTIRAAAAAGDRARAGRRRGRRLPARRAVRPRGRRPTAAKFVTSGVTWGFFCSTPGVAVGRNLQRKHAMEMLLTGDLIDAQQALEWGLVNRVVPAEQLDRGNRQAGQADRREAAGAPSPPASAPSTSRWTSDLGAGLRARRRRDLPPASPTPKARAGMDAFIEKRDPPGRS